MPEQRQNSQNFRFSIQNLIDQDGLIKKELISDIGNNNVKDLAEFLSQQYGNSKGVTINQIRKFYDTFLNIYNNNSTVDEKKIQLIMMKAQVEYAVKRLKIDMFGKFIQNRINLVVASDANIFEKVLDAFKLHFEALIGYFPKQ